MAQNKSYIAKRYKIIKSCMTGMEPDAEGGLRLCAGQLHFLFLRAFRAPDKGQRWGRLRFGLKLHEEGLCIVRALALDEGSLNGRQSVEEFLMDGQIPPEKKISFLEEAGCTKSVNHTDLLLYEQKGSCLWLSWEISGSAGRLYDIRADAPGDNFLQTFPEIYREEGGFFHRYLSIFSSIYNDFQEEIDSPDRLPTPERAPVPVLYEYASWLGMRIPEGLLEEPALRRLVTEGFSLNRMRGTGEALLRIVDIVLGRRAIVVERSRLPGDLPYGEAGVINRLYGSEERDVTILLPGLGDLTGEAGERTRSSLYFLLKQYAPARCRLRLVCCGECSSMDSYCYMDYNARLYRTPEGALDKGGRLDYCRLTG